MTSTSRHSSVIRTAESLSHGVLTGKIGGKCNSDIPGDIAAESFACICRVVETWNAYAAREKKSQAKLFVAKKEGLYVTGSTVGLLEDCKDRFPESSVGLTLTTDDPSFSEWKGVDLLFAIVPRSYALSLSPGEKIFWRNITSSGRTFPLVAVRVADKFLELFTICAWKAEEGGKDASHICFDPHTPVKSREGVKQEKAEGLENSKREGKQPVSGWTFLPTSADALQSEETEIQEVKRTNLDANPSTSLDTQLARVRRGGSARDLPDDSILHILRRIDTIGPAADRAFAENARFDAHGALLLRTFARRRGTMEDWALLPLVKQHSASVVRGVYLLLLPSPSFVWRTGSRSYDAEFNSLVLRLVRDLARAVARNGADLLSCILPRTAMFIIDETKEHVANTLLEKREEDDKKSFPWTRCTAGGGAHSAVDFGLQPYNTMRLCDTDATRAGFRQSITELSRVRGQILAAAGLFGSLQPGEDISGRPVCTGSRFPGHIFIHKTVLGSRADMRADFATSTQTLQQPLSGQRLPPRLEEEQKRVGVLFHGSYEMDTMAFNAAENEWKQTGDELGPGPAYLPWDIDVERNIASTSSASTSSVSSSSTSSKSSSRAPSCEGSLHALDCEFEWDEERYGPALKRTMSAEHETNLDGDCKEFATFVRDEVVAAIAREASLLQTTGREAPSRRVFAFGIRCPSELARRRAVLPILERCMALLSAYDPVLLTLRWMRQMMCYIVFPGTTAFDPDPWTLYHVGPWRMRRFGQPEELVKIPL